MVSLISKTWSRLLFKYPTRTAETIQCEFNQVLNILEPNIQIPKCFKLFKSYMQNVIVIQWFHWIQRAWLSSLFMFQQILIKHKIWKSKYYTSKYENFICSLQKIQKNVKRIHLQCGGFIEILNMNITDPTERKIYWIWLDWKHSIKFEHLEMPSLSTVINHSVCNSGAIFVIPLRSYTKLWQVFQE